MNNIMHLKLQNEHGPLPKIGIFDAIQIDLSLEGIHMAQELMAQLAAGEAKFADVIAYIDARYAHTPTAFKMVNRLMLPLKTKAVPKYFHLPN